MALGNARTSNGFGANPITWSDVHAWAVLTRQQPTPWEISVLRRLDGAVLAALNEKGASKGGDAAPAEIEPDDAAGMHTLFGGLRARSKAAFAKP